MPNQYINKLVLGTETKFDLTGDTVDAAHLTSGFTAHDKSGAPIVGTNTFDVDSTDANAAVAEILLGKTVYARGKKLTGSMPNNGAVAGVISTKAGQYAIPMGFHDGSGKVGISSTEQNKIIPGNIKKGVTILGQTGTYGGEAVKAQSNKSVTPGMSQKVITPDSGYDYLAQVTVAAVPYTETDNSAGGKTITIGG